MSNMSEKQDVYSLGAMFIDCIAPVLFNMTYRSYKFNTLSEHIDKKI